MVIIAFPKEILKSEQRCALLPQQIKAYQRLGLDVRVESGLGKGIFIDDRDYQEAGATVLDSREELLAKADILVSLQKLPMADVASLKPSALVISFLDPFNEVELLTGLLNQGVTSLSVEMLPRISRCQKMDALSSQASLAGYVMVSKGMQHLSSVMPMMMTPAGTLKPMKVFVIGAGVAGLQAIATAKRLGAQVTAFDTRDVVAEQVQSLGAKFLHIDLGRTEQTGQGYATALTDEQMAIQQREQAKCIADSDLVITTAQLFGRKPPQLISDDVIAQMKPGSVIVDMAAENGGNVEGSVAGETVLIHGVKVVGTGMWANEVAKDASQMYSSNMLNLISECWDEEAKILPILLDDEILGAAIITHQGKLVNKMLAGFHGDRFSKFNDTNALNVANAQGKNTTHSEVA